MSVFFVCSNWFKILYRSVDTWHVCALYPCKMCVINYPALPKIESWVHHWVQRSKMWEWDTTLGRGLGNNSREEKLLVVLGAISNFAFDRYLYCVRELCICICHCHCSAQNQTNVYLRCATIRESMTTTRESLLFFFSKKKRSV